MDTNTLLRLIDVGDPQHAVVRTSLERLSGEFIVPPQALYELFVVLTRPKEVNGSGQPVPYAASIVRNVAEQFSVPNEPPELWQRWISLCEKHGVRGRQAHDARIVAYADALGIEGIFTLNGQDFRRYENLQVLEPVLTSDL